MTTEQREFFDEVYGGKINEGFGLDYNLFCCEQGILISESLNSEDEIIKFHKLSWESQVKMVPGLDDGHSGNTFQMSCRLAIQYLPMLKVIKRDDTINKILE
jgi:hypothetical protein